MAPNVPRVRVSGVKSFPSAAATGWCRQNRCFIRRARLTVVVTLLAHCSAGRVIRRTCTQDIWVPPVVTRVVIIHRRVGGSVRAWVSCARARVVGTGDGCTPSARYLTCFITARAHTRTHTHVYAHAHARHGFLETARISPLQGRGLTARGPSLNHGRRRGARRYRFALMGAADRRIPPNAPGRVLRRGRVDPCGEFRDETKIPFVQRVFYFVVVAARVMRVHCLRPAYSKPAFLRLFDVAQHWIIIFFLRGPPKKIALKKREVDKTWRRTATYIVIVSNVYCAKKILELCGTLESSRREH